MAVEWERRKEMEILVKALWILAVAIAIAAPARAEDVKRVTKEELKSMLGSPDVIVVDVRTGSDWASSDSKIRGALREDPDQVDKWMAKYPKDKTLVFYCA
jgi:predicted sulfurtransferase